MDGSSSRFSQHEKHPSEPFVTPTTGFNARHRERKSEKKPENVDKQRNRLPHLTLRATEQRAKSVLFTDVS